MLPSDDYTATAAACTAARARHECLEAGQPVKLDPSLIASLTADGLLPQRPVAAADAVQTNLSVGPDGRSRNSTNSGNGVIGETDALTGTRNSAQGSLSGAWGVLSAAAAGCGLLLFAL
jgi:hypothetical protein